MCVLQPGLKARETITKFTFFAASGCCREMGGTDAAESMDAKLVDDPTEESFYPVIKEIARHSARSNMLILLGGCKLLSDRFPLRFFKSFSGSGGFVRPL
jgi:hypothetical protein